MNFVDLDAMTRKYMQDEVELDVRESKLYPSRRLSPQGATEYPDLLRAAVTSGDDGTLASSLRKPGILNLMEERKKPTGGFTSAKVPVNAAEILAEGEFNRFYARGLCLRAVAEGIDKVVVYRGKEVLNPRPESEALLGKHFPVEELLQDLRQHIGTDTALGLPAGPNSGLSVRFK
jgi:hypothetical protein